MSTFPRTQIIVILGALSAFGSLSIDMYLPSLPTLQHDFATTQLGTQLTLAAFFVGFALGQAFVGPLSDRFGRKPPLIIGLALYVISSLGCAFARPSTPSPPCASYRGWAPAPAWSSRAPSCATSFRRRKRRTSLPA